MSKHIAATRLASAWLLTYPDDELLGRVDQIAAVVAELPAKVNEPLTTFLACLGRTPLLEMQEHFVATFDMKRKACPYLTYWTDGDTRNRGRAILRFKQAYLDAGYELSPREGADHLSVVLEFAAVGDELTGDALLAEHAGPIHLLRDALGSMDSPYVHVLDAVVATLPTLTPGIRRRMAELASAGPPVETVGLEPFGVTSLGGTIGARR